MNPESVTISYVYDNNGNLTQKTDARNVQTTYLYDNLNRVLTRSYTGESGYQTPTVSYFYDNLPNAKGKLIKVATTLSETRYLAFDILGRVTGSQQMTDNVSYNP
jgi:YD repeat-containing protein